MVKNSITIKPQKTSEEKLIDFKKISAIIEKNFIVMTRDKIRLVPLLIFPIIMILVLGYVSGNTPKHISAAIVVNDESQLSETISQAISGSEYFSVKKIVSTEGEARQLLDSGYIQVIVEIPPNLEDDVRNNIKKSIIVIVDESDSSIALTSKQVLSSIIKNIGTGISMQKLEGYKQSVGKSGEEMSSYIKNLPEDYSTIYLKTSSAESVLIASKNIIDQSYNSILITQGAPQMGQISGGTYYYNNNNSYYVVNDTTYAVHSSQTNSLLAQQLLFKQLSTLTGNAINDVHKASVAAKSANINSKIMLENNYNANVLEPLNNIQMFAQSDSEEILQPIEYEEKPAYGVGKRVLDFMIPALIAMTIFQGAVMGMGRAVAGEKREGSLTRVFLTPTSNFTIIFGTLSFYVIFELVRASILILFSIIMFGIHIEGNLLLITFILTVYISISAGLGMIISSIVKTEQQFIAMAMLISLPTMFLSGAFFPVSAMPKFMQIISYFLPVTYAGSALRSVMVKNLGLSMILYPLGILFIFLILTIIGVVIFFRRDVE